MAIKAKAEVTISRIVDIDKTTRYYILQSSTLAAPSKPADGAAIGSNWSKTEPSYLSGSTMTLYFVDQTIMSNGSITYSEVSKSSSYEAAKEAWNKANSAQSTANITNEKVNGLQVGGRNLLIRSSMINNKPSCDDITIMNSITSFTYTDEGCHLVTPNEGNVNNGFGIFFKNFGTLGINPGDAIIFSFDVKGTSDNNTPFANILMPENTSNWWTGVQSKTIKFTPRDTFERVVVNYVVPDDADSFSNSSIYFAIHGNMQSDLYIRNCKIEKGNMATDWTPAPEDAVNTVNAEYYLSTSQTSLSGGSWSTTPPTWVNGRYMWSRTVTTDGAGNKTYSPSQNGVCIAGAKGDKGDTGAAGKGIKSSTITYQLSSSRTTAPTGTWLSSPPTTDIAKPYLWTRTIFTFTDDTTSNPVYSVSSTFDSLQVGGRNLLLGTSKADVNSNWVKEGWTGNFTSYDPDNRIYKLTAINGWTCFRYIGLDDYAGEIVTISFKAKNIKEETTATTTYALFIANATGNNPYVTNTLTVNKPEQDTWISVKATITLNSDGQLGIGSYCTPEGQNLISTWLIKDLKLEKGNMATDWTPAPEDLESRVESAETDIANNATEISLKASQTEVTALSNDLNVYKDSTTTMLQNVNGWQFNWDKLIRTAEADLANHQDYITLQNGDIILGESASELKLKIGNDAIQFKGTADKEVVPDSDATAWITGQKFNINEGEIHRALRIGKLQFLPRPNGNFAISIVQGE